MLDSRQLLQRLEDEGRIVDLINVSNGEDDYFNLCLDFADYQDDCENGRVRLAVTASYLHVIESGTLIAHPDGRIWIEDQVVSLGKLQQPA